MTEKIVKFDFANNELRSIENEYTNSLKSGEVNPTIWADRDQLTRAADEMGGASGREERVLVEGNAPTQV